jgi:hypothetical protein
MLTPEFVTRLHLAKRAIELSHQAGGSYEVADLARDLQVPVPVARLLLNFVGAILAEERMAAQIACDQAIHSEAQH